MSKPTSDTMIHRSRLSAGDGHQKRNRPTFARLRSRPVCILRFACNQLMPGGEN
jgi:hypothetical protein